MPHGPHSRRPLGLDNVDAVEKCTDLGQSYVGYFDRNDTATWPPPPPQHMETIAKLRKELEARYDWDGHSSGDRSRYIPSKALRDFMNPNLVFTALRLLDPHAQEDELKRRRDDICFGKKPCWKLLATLILAEKHDEFHQLRDEGMWDACLPLAAQHNGVPTAPPCCREPDHEHTALSSENWSLNTWDNLVTSSRAVNALYLKRVLSGDRHIHYILRSNDLLPIKTPFRTIATQTDAKEAGEKDLAGGFGRVTRVWFHADNCEFSSLNGDPTTDQKSFALKQLFSSDVEAFNKELASLLYVKRVNNSHLIELLATFEIRDQTGNSEFYLVFPWAEGNLWHFWKNHDTPEQRRGRETWMADQCYKLARALQLVHGERDEQLSHYPDIPQNQQEIYGRHGDVKAENVLYFEQDTATELVMTDFGLGRLHTRYSRSGINPGGIETSNTYRAPEFDLDQNLLSRRADIFSLGCMYLEFVTWYLCGYESASDRFVQSRTEANPSLESFYFDTFFVIQTDSRDGTKTAHIKGSVLEWINKLKRTENPFPPSNYVTKFLDLIQNKMLTPYPTERIQITELVIELRNLRGESLHAPLDD
ncbi:Kinase-like domain-containing protein [Madurella fahalii]|uniref:Kinase-like domain-containing protein n=1 Tax=Madurella fahalii TaxID=1157608 RepID=A0ABQ0G2C9_9PEZI